MPCPKLVIAGAAGPWQSRAVHGTLDCFAPLAMTGIFPMRRGQDIMDDWNLPWTGGCRCGKLRFEISAPPLITMACRSEEHTSEPQSLMRISYAAFCLQKKTIPHAIITTTNLSRP